MVNEDKLREGRSPYQDIVRLDIGVHDAALLEEI